MNTVLQTPLTSAAIVGLGYVGPPTALALHGRCQHVIGIHISQDRLDVMTPGKPTRTRRTRPCSPRPPSMAHSR